MIGKQAPVVTVVDDRIGYDKNMLNSILMKCGSRPISIVAVAGDFRQGKSFLLNMFLRFLHRSVNKASELNEYVSGFEARGGSNRVTQGISFWSEPFFVKNKNDIEIAIILCDTQGLFDNSTPSKINSFIFGFSAIIPSMLIFNLKDNIKENSLDNLAVFAPKMGRMASFQHVLFLIRDWYDEDTHPRGSIGGIDYVDKVLTNPNHEQMANTRNIIRKWFPSISGCLLPPPGTHVERSKSNSQIEVSRIESDFVSVLDELCAEIFLDKVQIKMRGNGTYTSAKEIVDFSTYLVKKYQDGHIEDPGTHWESDSKQVCENAKNKAFWGYNEWMPAERLKEQEKTKEIFVSDKFLTSTHKAMKQRALHEFLETTRIFSHCMEFNQKLDEEIERQFKIIARENDETRKRRQAETARQEAEEREREAKIALEENQREKERLEEEHRRQLREEEEKRKREMEQYRIKLEQEKKGSDDCVFL